MSLINKNRYFRYHCSHCNFNFTAEYRASVKCTNCGKSDGVKAKVNKVH